MKMLLLVLLFALLAVFDCIAVAMLVSMPALAVLIHLGIVALGYTALRAFIDEGDAGRRTLAILCGLLCLVTPVLGCIAVAFLLQIYCRTAEKTSPPADFIIGNPLAPGRAKSPVGEPLVYAFVHAPSAESHQLTIPLLRHRLDRKAVTLLQRLSVGGDSRTQLFAQNAIASSVENREQTLNDWRRRTEKNPTDSLAHLNLGEMLFTTAESGLFDDIQAQRYFQEASHHFGEAAKIDPQNPAAIFGKGIALIRQNQLDDVPEWYGRLCAISDDPDGYNARLETELFAASGNWERTQMAARKLTRSKNESRRFWNPNPISEPTGSVHQTNPIAS